MRKLAFFVLFFWASIASAYEVEVIQHTGDPQNRVDVLVLGDGYTASQQDKMSTDAASFLSEMFSQTPYQQYKNFFNVKLVHVVSNQDGADNGMYGYGSQRDTALGAYYYCMNVQRALCVNASAVYNVANQHAPEWDYLFVMVNDTTYGGTGGQIAVFSVHPLAGEIAIHEFGHTYAGLADEYEDSYPGYPQCGSDCPEPNATTRTVREQVKWNLWIDQSTPVPTPETSQYSQAIGVFEGCRYFSSGVYRPKQRCKMRELGVAYDSVCSEANVLAAYRLVDPIDAIDPPSPVTLQACDSVTLSVQRPRPEPDTMETTWLVDGQVVQTGGDTFELDSQGLSAGSYTVTVRVEDMTGLVRNDPENLLRSERTWQVEVQQSTGSGTCTIAGRCYSGGTSNPDNPCQVCDPSRDQSGWSNVADGTSCDDGAFCNGAETCRAGSCTAGTPSCADDGLDCTDTCDEGSDACNVLQPGFCLIGGQCFQQGEHSPQNPCKVCQPAANAGDWTNELDGTPCQDGDYCNGKESCQAGVCSPGVPPCEDDGLECTTTCDEESDACNVLQDGFCLIDGACFSAGQSDPSNPCRACDPSSSAFSWTPVEDGTACDDGIFCNGEETCLSGLCMRGADPCAGLDCAAGCDEGTKGCIVKDGWCLVDGACFAAGDQSPVDTCLACDPARDSGGFSPVSGGPCDDGDPCTVDDTCSEGVCSGRRSSECSERCPCVSGGCACGTAGGSGGWCVAAAMLVLFSLRRKKHAPPPRMP